ncbi:MAG: helix-turn-helix transcriptional regulator [Pseudomonadota bacterium]
MEASDEIEAFIEESRRYFADPENLAAFRKAVDEAFEAERLQLSDASKSITTSKSGGKSSIAQSPMDEVTKKRRASLGTGQQERRKIGKFAERGAEKPEDLVAKAAELIGPTPSTRVQIVSLDNELFAFVFRDSEFFSFVEGFEDVKIKLVTKDKSSITFSAGLLAECDFSINFVASLGQSSVRDWIEENGVEFDKSKLEKLRLACNKLMNSKEKTDTSTTEKFTAAADPKEIGAILAEARKAAGMTQQQVADAMGADRSNVIRLEKGRTNATITTIEKYAEAVGMKFILSMRPIDSGPAHN